LTLPPVPAAVSGVSYLDASRECWRFHQTLYVTEQFQLGQFGQVVMSSGGRLPQPTNIVLPGSQAQSVQAANDLNQIIVDDELQNQNPDPIRFGRGGNPLSAANTLRGADSADIAGVMTYTWAGNSSSGNAYGCGPSMPRRRRAELPAHEPAAARAPNEWTFESCWDECRITS
jgi:predicted extracellular nuclease